MLKPGRMYLYFVDETNRAYYQSPMFGRCLGYLQANPRRAQLRQKGEKRSMLISDVPTVEGGRGHTSANSCHAGLYSRICDKV